MSETNNTQTQETNTQQSQQTAQTAQSSFDYEKLASLISGKQTVAEDTVLKNYFKQQGMSSDEMSQAISSYKEQKAKNTPNVEELQSTITSERSARMKAEINSAATLEAIKQGVDVKSIPYLLKMAEFKDCTDKDGKIISDKLGEAVKKVLDDIPALKSAVNNNSSTITQIGGDGEQEEKVKSSNNELRKAFGLKPKN